MSKRKKVTQRVKVIDIFKINNITKRYNDEELTANIMGFVFDGNAGIFSPDNITIVTKDNDVIILFQDRIKGRLDINEIKDMLKNMK